MSIKERRFVNRRSLMAALQRGRKQNHLASQLRWKVTVIPGEVEGFRGKTERPATGSLDSAALRSGMTYTSNS